MTTIEHWFKLRYRNTDNSVVFAVKEGKRIFGSFSVDLNDYKPDWIYKFWIDIIDEKDHDNDYEFQIGVLCESENRSNKDEDDFTFTHSLKRKVPDRIDILNEESETNFISKVKTSLLSQIEFEKSMLSEYYSDEEIFIMLNQKYNFIVSRQTMGIKNLSLEDLYTFNQNILHNFVRNDFVEKIFEVFTTTTKQALNDKTGDTNNILDKAAVILLSRTMARRNNKLYGMENQDNDTGFSIRNYVVTLILMSSLTVGQKLDMLYEVFDWEDGEGDGLDSHSIKLMFKTILNRNLQYVASNQVNNMVELTYDGYATCISSCVYSSYPSSDSENVPFDYAVKGLKYADENDNFGNFEDEDDLIETTDLTEVFRDILWKYHRAFGTKDLWFHPKYSPFRDLNQVIKFSDKDIYLRKRQNCENVLWIVYITNGVKRVFTAYYNGENKLVRVGEDMEKDESQGYTGVEKILQDSKYYCYMENYPKVIPKDIFITKSLNIAYLSDFMRTETVMRCNELGHIKDDEARPLKNTLSIQILGKKNKPLFECKFDKNVPLDCDPSLTDKLVDDDSFKQFVRDGNNFVTISFSPAYETNSLSDLATRVKVGVKLAQAEFKLKSQEAEDLNFEFFKWEFVKSGDIGRILSSEVELEDIVSSEGYNLTYRPIIEKEACEREAMPLKTVNDADFDSYCLLQEIGVTNQWVSCKIHDKKGEVYTVELKTRKGYMLQKNREDLLLSKVEMQKYEQDMFDL